MHCTVINTLAISIICNPVKRFLILSIQILYPHVSVVLVITNKLLPTLSIISFTLFGYYSTKSIQSFFNFKLIQTPTSRMIQLKQFNSTYSIRNINLCFIVNSKQTLLFLFIVSYMILSNLFNINID